MEADGAGEVGWDYGRSGSWRRHAAAPRAPAAWSDGDLARPPADLARPRAPTSSIQHASRTVEEDVGCCVPRRQGKLQARTDGFGAGGD
jgi:hypothetical protein